MYPELATSAGPPPSPRRPSQAQLTYAKTLLELLLLLLALPWLVIRLFRDPDRTLRAAGEHHLG